MPRESMPAMPPAAPDAPAAPASLATRGRAAVLVAAVWTVAGLPVVFGLSSCPVARFLHAPCPGCGMTRAMQLLASGEVAASMHMHPLAIPTALAQLVFAAVTVALTLQRGSPFSLWSSAWGRGSVYAVGAVLGLDVVLWIARFCGALGGPVPV